MCNIQGGNLMKKISYRITTIIVVIAILLSAFNMVFPIISFAEQKSYSASFIVKEPHLLTDLNGDSSTVIFDSSEGYIGMAVSPGVTNDGRLFGTDYYYGYTWTDESYTIANQSGKGTSGEVVYYSSYAMSDIRFDTSYSVNEDFWLAKPLEFYASSDGITYKKIETTRELAGVNFTNHNFLGINSKIYDTYTFSKQDNIHYVKIVSVINSANNDYAKAVNRIYNIEYNKYEDEVTYSNSFKINNPFSVSDLGENNSTLKLDSSEGYIGMAVSPSVTDNGRVFGNDYYYGYSWTDSSYTISNESNNGASGQVVYYSDEAIGNIRFDTSYSVKEDFWLAKPLEFYASSDGTTYEKIETTRELAGVSFTNPNFSGLNSQIYDTYTFAEEDNVHYIKIVSVINSTDNAYAKAVNRIYGIDYNTYIKTIDYTSRIDAADYYTVKSFDNTLVELRKVPAILGTNTAIPEGYMIADSTKTDVVEVIDGEVIYYSYSAFKDIRFDTSYMTAVNGDNWTYSNPLEFYGSKDGIEYKKLSTKQKLGKKSDNPNFKDNCYEHVYDMVSFEETEEIHFVKIKISGSHKNLPYLPRIFGIDYTRYAAAEVEYTREFNPDVYYSVTGADNTDVIFTRLGAISDSNIPAGWTITKADKSSVADGEVVYFAKYAIEHIKFDTCYQTVNGWHSAPLEFYASNDGVTYKKIITEQSLGAVCTHPGFSDTYDHVYDTVNFLERDNIRYIKIKIDTNNNSEYLPRIFDIKYTVHNDPGDKPTPKRYENEVMITPDNEEIVIECEEGVALDSPKRINGGWGAYHIYTFIKGEVNMHVGAEPDNIADGSVIIKSNNDKPITDWSFGGICGPDVDWAGSFSFLASSDGKNWRKIDYSVQEGADYLSAWGSVEYEYNGSFLPEENCKYIKIVKNSGNFAFMPAYRYLLYSTEGYDPDKLQPAESYLNRMEEKNYFEKGNNFYLFRTGSPAVDFDLHVIEPISDTATVAVTAGTEQEGSDIDYLATAVRVLVKDNGDGTGEYRYYNTFYKSRQITHIKVALNGAKFLYLDYNLLSGAEDTERRHYEDVPIVEPYEDLELEYINSPFYEGKETGVSIKENAYLHNNGSKDAAEWIGGQFGYLSGTSGRDYSIIMETPYLHDFTFRYAFASEDSHKIRQLKAYGISVWAGEEVEIPLVRYLDENYKSAGYKNYIFRPANQKNTAKCNYNWIRIEVLCETNTDYSELLEFTYFYDIPPVPTMPMLKKPAKGLKEMIDSFDSPMLLSKDGGKAHEYYNLKWINFNMGYNGSDHFVMQENYGADAYIIYQRNGIKGFDIRGYKIITSIYDLEVFASEDGVEWTAVKTNYLEKTLLSNWRGFSYTADSSAIPENTNYLKLFFTSDMETDIDIVVSDVQIVYTGKSNVENSVEDSKDEDSKTEESEDEKPNTEDIKDENSEDDNSFDDSNSEDFDYEDSENEDIDYEEFEDEDIVYEDAVFDDGSDTTDELKDSKSQIRKLVIRKRIKPVVIIVGGSIALAIIVASIVLTIVLIKKKHRSKAR